MILIVALARRQPPRPSRRLAKRILVHCDGPPLHHCPLPPHDVEDCTVFTSFHLTWQHSRELLVDVVLGLIDVVLDGHVSVRLHVSQKKKISIVAQRWNCTARGQDSCAEAQDARFRWLTKRVEIYSNDFGVFLELINRFEFEFLRRENYFLKESNFWCVHVNVPWPVCTHAIPFRMLWFPRFMMTEIYISMKPLWKVVQIFR